MAMNLMLLNGAPFVAVNEEVRDRSHQCRAPRARPAVVLPGSSALPVCVCVCVCVCVFFVDGGYILPACK